MARLPACIVGFFWAVLACEDPPPSEPAPPKASAAGSTTRPVSRAVAPLSCQPVKDGVSFTLGTPPARIDEDESSPLLLPRAVELGDAAWLPPGVGAEGGPGFAATHLGEASGETHAHVALVQADASRGRVVDLGRVHGLVVPPRAVAASTAVLVAVADGDASGTITRLARIGSTPAESGVSWGSQVPQGNDTSPEFGLAASGDRALLVWDDWDDARAHGTIRAVAVNAASAVTAGEPTQLSSPGSDAEIPRVVARTGGFWVAWTVNAPVSDSERRHVPADEAPGVLLGPRWVELSLVSADGKAEGAPIAVTPKDGRVLGFDLMPLGAGAAIVWRDDTTSPATPGGRVLLARVTADGSVERSLVTDDSVGAGEPMFLPRPGSGGWLVFADAEDRPRLAEVSASGGVGPVMPTEGLAPGMPLIAADDGLIVATPRGRSVELSLRRCRPR